MKKGSLLIILISALFVLTSCTAASLSSQPASSASGSTSPVSRVSPDVIFREGTESTGKTVLSSGDIVGFYTKYTKFNHTYQIVFELTENGKKSFSEATTRLTQSGGSISLWAEGEKVVSLSVYAPITDGSVAISEKDKDSVKSICKKLQG